MVGQKWMLKKWRVEEQNFCGWTGVWVRVRGKVDGVALALAVALIEDDRDGLCDGAGKMRERRSF